MPLLALLILLAQNLGFGRAYPWALIPFDLGRWAWIAASVGLLALLAEQAGLFGLGDGGRRAAAWVERTLAHRAALIALIAGNALFAVVSWNHYSRFGYGFPWAHLALLAAAAPFVRRDRFWLSCAVGLALLVASIVHFPLAAERSDMLPLIQQAWNDLATGKSPYGLESLPEKAEWPMRFLPGTLFSHGPAWVLGIDLRWNQALWRLLWMVGIGAALSRHKADSPWRTVAHVFALNPYYNFRHDLYYEVVFAGIAAYHAWPRWRWLTLPALMWTRRWAWVVAPFLALDWLLVRGQAPQAGTPGKPLDWRTAARQAGWLALGMLLVSGAAVLALQPTTDATVFIRAVLRFPAQHPFDYGLALGPLADKLGVIEWLRPAQAVLVAALGLLTLWRRRRGPGGAERTEAIERMGLVALCVAVLLNPFHEVYFWLEPAFWILAAYALREEPRRLRSARQPAPQASAAPRAR